MGIGTPQTWGRPRAPHLLILLSVSLMWGNFSRKVSFMSFLRSEGFTYSITVVCSREDHPHAAWGHPPGQGRWLHAPSVPTPQPPPGRRPYHVGREDEHTLVLAAGPLRVIQQVGVVLQGIPHIGPCGQRAALTHHEPGAWVSGHANPSLG